METMKIADPTYTGTQVTHSELKVGAYYPLSLNYRNEEAGRNWSLNFRLQPDKAVIYEGDEATFQEIHEVLKLTNYPIAMIEVVQCIIGDCVARRNGNDIDKA